MYAKPIAKAHPNNSVLRVRGRVFLAATLIVSAFAGTSIADNDPVGTWGGTLTSDNYLGGTLTTWIFRADGTSEGSWTMNVVGGVVVSSNNASGTYTYSGGALTASYTGTATESGSGTSTSYNLNLTNGTIDGDSSEGSYDITFTNPYWTADGGTWQMSRQASTISEHVYWISIETVWDYENPDDDTDSTYEFELDIVTDDTVELVEFLTPAGNTFEIPKLPDQYSNGIWTNYEYYPEYDVWVWEYDTDFAAPSDLEAYGDGWYTVTVHYASGQDQTRVWFGIPGTTDPIPQPTRKPVLTSPPHNGTLKSPVTFSWQPCTDPNATEIWVAAENEDTGEEVENGLDLAETSWGPVALSEGFWEAWLSFDQFYYLPDNGDGIQVEVGKYCESDCEFMVEGPIGETISDHVFWIEIEQGLDYEDPTVADDLRYEFWIEIGTDNTVDLVEFLTPAGNTFEIPKLPEQCSNGICTSYGYEPEYDSWYWYYEADFADLSDLQAYGDGLYSITVHYAGGGQAQTTAWFGIPDTSDPIPQPMQEPVLTFPLHNGKVVSPVTFIWQQCTDANTEAVWVQLEKEQTGEELESGFDVGETSWGPVPLSSGYWEAEISFYSGYYIPDNGDGIWVEGGKFTESDYEFRVAGLTVSGRVTDKATSLPLADVAVGCWHEDEGFWTETRTNEVGEYEITNLSPGEVEITARPDSYYACMGKRTELNEDVNNMDFALPVEAILMGKVLDAETAQPLAGVEVAYWSDRYVVWQNDFTDGDGGFTLTNLPPGSAELTARPDVATGYAWSLPWGANWICLAEGEHRSRRMIALHKGALVSGYIKNPDNSPASYIDYEYAGRMIEGWGYTDVEGHYQIRLPEGTYAIGEDDDYLNGLPAKVTITDINQAVEVNDIIVYDYDSGGQISGGVNNPGAHPQTGQFVVIALEAGTVVDPNTWYAVWPVGEAELAEAGPFEITALPPDANYDVHLCVESETQDEIESLVVRDSVFDVGIGTTNLTLNYSSAGWTVTGTVTNTSGQPVLGACVLLVDSASGNFAGFGDVDPNGKYVIYGVSAGTYTATAVHSKYLNASTTVQVTDSFAGTLVGHWKMNDNADNPIVVDSSDKGNAGAAQRNTSVLHADGKIDGALTFNGSSDYIDCGNDGSLALTTWSMSVWVYRSVGSGNRERIIAKSDSSQFDYWLQIQHTDVIQAGFSDTEGTLRSTDTAEPLSPGRWYHVVATWDGTYITIYIDGALNATSDDFSSYIARTSTAPVNIGRLGYKGTWYYDFSGRLDNIMIFNRALTTTQIAFLYNGGAGTETLPTSTENSLVMSFAGEKEGADLNGTGIVDVNDVAAFSDEWLESGSLDADFNRDSGVDFADWARVADNWLWRAIWLND